MKSKNIFSSFAVAAVLLAGGPAFADTIVGLPALTGTGNCYPFGCAYNNRYQQVYTSGAFSGSMVITGLEFFNTSYNSYATALNTGLWSISLSTTSTDWNTLSSTFASNVGADNKQVFDGDIGQAWAYGDTLDITLSTPFVYNPGAGNLLMDVTVSGATDPGGAVYFDATQGKSVSRNWSGNISTGYGLVTGFVTGRDTQVPEPASLALLGLGAAGLGLFRRRKSADRA